MDWWQRRKRNKKLLLMRGAKLLEELIKCCDGKSNPIKFFSADEIIKATDSFSRFNRLYEFNSFNDLVFLNPPVNFDCQWYSGKNQSQHKILVKKLYIYGDENMICRDIAVSSMVSGHKSFLNLKHNKLDISRETWKRRMKIAEDIAIGLAYLHTAFPRPFVYRCMRLENIFVDEDGVAKLTDFSLCVSIPQGETFVQVDDSLVELYYYADFNSYPKSSVISEKTDVFAFGILILQRLLIGREGSWQIWVEANKKGYSERNVDDDSHQFWLSKFWRGERRMEEIADQDMLDKMVADVSEEERCQMKAFLMLSLRCVGHEGEIPTMVEVAKELKKIQKIFLVTTASRPFFLNGLS
ncbi:hypothetical protein CARUB_v10021685mg [Capsella rubella]|uniref:Protein kinase domain-containing protein n=1 Tax=Capsella rubella TaxID=81985 RepID=R0GEF0_9BRAS|nr:hypothetical protein CARUB_v10021685mg [Capsella rubella]